jgi:hypothetical protein
LWLTSTGKGVQDVGHANQTVVLLDVCGIYCCRESIPAPVSSDGAAIMAIFNMGKEG